MTGLILAGSTVGYRMAIINVEGHILDATIYLSILAVFIQSIMMGIWLYYYKRNEFRLVFQFWKQSLPAGICGSGATAGWFLAFALATAAEVRAVGQIELIFSIIISIIFFKEKVQRTEIFGICMSALFTFFAYSFNDDEFVKIQPTIFNGFFSAVLLFGIFYKKAMMKQFFGSQFSLNDETWYKLSLRWGLFFLFLTIINEISWRFLETEDWVFIKVFVLSPLVGIFMLCQLPITLKGRIKTK